MTFRYMLFVVLTLAMTAFLCYGTYTTNRLLRTWVPDRNLLLLPGETVVRLVLIAGCIGLGMLSGLPFGQLGWTWTGWGVNLLLGSVLGAVLAFLFVAGTRRFLRTGGSRFYSDQILAHIVPKTGGEWVWVALAMIGVALLQELLFRSLLLGGLTPVLPAWLLLLTTALLFGTLHSPQGLWGMGGAALAGLFLGLLFFWSGSVLLPLTAHYVTNMIQVTVVMVMGGPESQAAESSSATGTEGNLS